jgi:hypothetical protein
MYDDGRSADRISERSRYEDCNSCQRRVPFVHVQTEGLALAPVKKCKQ